MNDDQLTQAGVSKFGRRVALRAFLNSTQPSEESHAQSDIVAQIKHHMAANNTMGSKNSKKKQLGNKNSAKRKFRIVNIGWLMDDLQAVRQVRLRRGGGTRKFQVGGTASIADFKDTAIDLFFLDGYSLHHGFAEEYNMSLSNFDGTIIEDESQTIEEVIEQYRLRKVQLYLYSKLRDSSSSDNPSVTTPRQSSWAALSMSTPVSKVNEDAVVVPPQSSSDDESVPTVSHICSGTPTVEFHRPGSESNAERLQRVLRDLEQFLTTTEEQKNLMNGSSAIAVKKRVVISNKPTLVTNVTVEFHRPGSESNAERLQRVLRDLEQFLTTTEEQKNLMNVNRHSVIEGAFRCFRRSRFDCHAPLWLSKLYSKPALSKQTLQPSTINCIGDQQISNKCSLMFDAKSILEHLDWDTHRMEMLRLLDFD
ncbi:hypothetical protein CAPTEDRAFT_191608 [Capitella teleta]|uniref:Uncharacterized protein n=1 Tax=Capitella teleta TaxID=283909 RepID=R7V0P0_CAPTE|nr:hypothetical protein CAPTEDRAFT_191608 [Capitella teleta]|eukprot:ELU09777.1 hypothetical protein CAPTEDRAFT_191608 [Capitella teleta]